MRELLIATGNKGKLVEMLDALGELPFGVKNLNDCDELVRSDVEETGVTFEENAILKAKTYGERSGLLTLAEDSGLEVDALDGRPGVLTARYAEGNDEARWRKLLDEMKDVPEGKRGARFAVVVAIYDPKTEKVHTCTGESKGRIVPEPQGTQGFGFDPVFFYEDGGKTGAMMSRPEKSQVSHRGRAMAKAKELLLAQYQTLA